MLKARSGPVRFLPLDAPRALRPIRQWTLLAATTDARYGRFETETVVPSGAGNYDRTLESRSHRRKGPELGGRRIPGHTRGRGFGAGGSDRTRRYGCLYHAAEHQGRAARAAGAYVSHREVS